MISPSKNKPARPAPRTSKPSGMFLAITCAMILAVVGIGAYFLFRDTAPAPDTTSGDKRPVAIADAAPTIADKIPGAVEATEDSTGQPPSADEKEFWQGQEVKEHRVVTNDTLIVETFITVDGKMHKYYHDERENVLPSAADQMLAIMTASDDGFGAPPLPHVENFENAFGDAVKSEIVINDSDSDEVKAIKKRVIAARAELLDLMAQGVSAADVVEEYKRAQEDNATIRLDAARGVQELLDTGDIAAAKELCAKYNEVLEGANIMPIEIPEEYLNEENNQ